ncbi:hypothetical protein ACPXCE_13695 [Streptomyces sp. DT24]|uniref:hypothetical protein n=1 Tax=unclassified Streptomyces TaxID=2593676 RepID=UPI0023B8FFC7|nr:hypothetical protein [Streptomyces sp. AM 4-1-1]WEH32757.1 hypothetical protein PZB75_04820 [Streptomyces sp. AM 4-1-1]
MRLMRRRARHLLAASAVAAVLLAPVGVYAATRGGAGAAAPLPPRPDPSGSDCRTSVEGSTVVAYCHNPYPSGDLVQLHTECARWWDVDADGAPVEVEPGRTVRLEDRCWKEVGSAWVTHRRAG